MTITERNIKLKQLVTCMKCQLTVDRECDDCSNQYKIGTMNEIVENLEEISKELDREPVIDKIRAEIEVIIGERNLDDYDFCSGLICARKIIDKYKAESEK